MRREWTRREKLSRRSKRGGTVAARRADVRNQFLVALDDATRPLIDPEEVTATAARLLGQHLFANRCAYAHVNPGETTIEISGDYSSGVASMVGRYPLTAFGEEFAGMMRAGAPYVVGDSETDPRTAPVREFYRAAQMRAVLSVPLHKRGTLVGGMAVHQVTPRRWRADEVELVRLVANRCWESIERAWVTRGLLRKTELLRLLAETGTRLLSEQRPERLMPRLLQQVGQLPGLEVSLHYRAADDGHHLDLAASYGIDHEDWSRLRRVTVDEALCGEVPLRGELVLCPHVQASTDPATAWVRALGVRAYVCFPLVSSGSLLGTLSFGTRSRDAYADEDLEFLRTLSDQVAAAYGRASAAMARHDSEERLQQALAIAELGTFEADLAADAVIVNQPGRATFGWELDEPITFSRVQSQFHPDDHARVMEAMNTALAPEGPGAFDIEHRIFRTDGAERWLRVRARGIYDEPDAPAVRCVGTFVDVTDRRHADARREHILQAERAARAEAERAARLKDEFLATVSHELRTPLNAILGWSQLMQRKQMAGDELQAAVETIDRNARAQGQLIDDLLDMSRIVSGRIRLEMSRVDLALVAGTAVESIQPSAQAKHLQVRAALGLRDPIVFGDAIRLQQVVWNLLSNAVKFTPPGGRVHVQLARVDQHVQLTVSDTGVGIAREFLPHIFEAFRQQDGSTTRMHGGLGLGLSIVKQLVELHGGHVSVDSGGPNEGSSFVIELPAAPVWEEADRPAHHFVGDSGSAGTNMALRLKGVRVLAVDDEPDALKLIQSVLEDAGATVVLADSADDAMRKLSDEEVDVLVSDLGMPGIDGYELIRRLREDNGSGTAALPAIALSAYVRPEDRQQALDAGYQLHVAKPLRVEELVRSVAEAVLTDKTQG